MSCIMMYVWPSDSHPLSLNLGLMGDISVHQSVAAHYTTFDNSNYHGAQYVPRNKIFNATRDTTLIMVHPLITYWLCSSFSLFFSPFLLFSSLCNYFILFGQVFLLLFFFFNFILAIEGFKSLGNFAPFPFILFIYLFIFLFFFLITISNKIICYLNLKIKSLILISHIN